MKNNKEEIIINILENKASNRELKLFAKWIKEDSNLIYFHQIKNSWHLSNIYYDNSNSAKNLEGKNRYISLIKATKKQRNRVKLFTIASSVVAAMIAISLLVRYDIQSHNKLLPDKPLPDKQVVELTNKDVKLKSLDKISITSQIGNKVVDTKYIITNKQSINVSSMSTYKNARIDSLPIINTIIVPKGLKSSEIILPDGTKMWINSDSQISFNSEFTDRERVVNVEGNAYFEVAKDSVRPFKVVANNVITTSLGTAFEVNTFDKEICHIALIEGSIKVENKLNSIIIEPNTEVAANLLSNILTKQSFVHGTYGQWRNNILVFNKECINSIIRKLNRWHNIEIVNQTFDLEEVLFTGKMEGVDIETHLDIVSKNISIYYEKKGDEYIIWN